MGISGVGAQVLLAGTALWFDLPHRLLHGSSELRCIALTLICYIGISIPSDLLGGYVLPRLHGRPSLGRAAFFAAWLRGVLSQAFVMSICSVALLSAAHWRGAWAGIACFALLMLILLAAQSVLARLVGGFRVLRIDASKTQASHHAAEDAFAVLPAPRSLVFESTDPGFVGGITGVIPGFERLVLPSAWLNELPPEVLAIEIVRRKGVLVTGTRGRGLIVALAWNLVGFGLACQLPGASLIDAPGLIQCGLWFTLWSFAGLLLLPSINRPGVLEADRFALEQGISPQALAAAISCLDRLQDDEPARTRWVERIFHPIPSVDSRVAAMHSSGYPRGAWQGARVALYLSWACFGFLSRAVHCNAGRPELWVLFPSD